ncbi:MAG: hypothetical protein M3Y56_12590 [Armatimonadota bacterium]|nr:hypothetical protein [Armatimonadota bacterium]
MKVLTEEQVDHFIERGYVRLEEAFSPQQALAAQDFLWERLAANGLKKEDPASWTEPLVHLKETYTDPVFGACSTERLRDAVEDLVGRGRWSDREATGNWGWWPVNFSLGSDRPWDVPTGGWHWDGQHFRHFADSPDQGLLLLCMFSETGSHGGATLVADGSHFIVARHLASRPEGWDHQEALRSCPSTHPWLAELTGRPYGEETSAATSRGGRIHHFMHNITMVERREYLLVEEAVASPGDVYLCHPFLYHAPSQNHSGVPRFMCNRTTPLRERMQIHRTDEDYSAVEISIRRALGL